MATTPHPLVWDFYKSVDGASNLGGVVHYYDEMSQSLWLSSGLHTDVAAVPEGHWEQAEWVKDIQITADEDLSILRLDHPSNGILYGVTTDGNSITFLRYIYGMDISQIVNSWSWTNQSDNAIAQFDGAIQNIDSEIFNNDSSLFQPGAKITVSIYIGDSNTYPIGTAWVDESGFDPQAETVSISARNSIGYFLKDQTFDDNVLFEGNVTDILTSILEYAGLSNFIIQPLEIELGFEFKPSDTLLSGIESILDFLTTTDEKMEIVELVDGTVCIGFDYWISEYLPRNYYSFDEGREVFKHKITRSSDSTFSKLRATGKDADGNELTPVTVNVDNFQYWSLGSHRTNHITAPDGLTQEGLQTWAEAQAKVFQYVGIAEDFVSPFRPQLVVGDIAEVVHGNIGTMLGIITQVKQAFDRQNGYNTSFSVDSGGVYMDAVSTYAATADSFKVYPRSAKANGYNRKQSIVDLVRYTAEKVSKVDTLNAKDIGAEPKGTSSDLLSKHNENVNSHSDIRSMIPKYTSDDYGKILSCDGDGFTWIDPVSVEVPDGDNVSY